MMKRLTTFCFLFLSRLSFAQADTATVREPQFQDSFDNKDLILLALAGFAVLIAIYFLYRRNRRRR